jgi:hypothetical protein
VALAPAVAHWRAEQRDGLAMQEFADVVEAFGEDER